MISDEKRREVAENLRNLTIGRSIQYKEQFFDELAEVVAGFEDYHDFDVVLEKLADLIDRPTCHDDDEREQYPVYTDWLFKCSYCGWDGQIWKSVGFGDMSSCVTNYCPNCGEAAL